MPPPSNTARAARSFFLDSAAAIAEGAMSIFEATILCKFNATRSELFRT